MTTNPEAGMRLVRAADLEEVRDLLAERIHGNPARSAGHNARLAVEAMLAHAPVAPVGGEGDYPDADGTDAAHPAWWRGHEHTTVAFCQKVNEILDGKDDGRGVSNEPWDAIRRRLIALAARAKPPGGEVVAWRWKDWWPANKPASEKDWLYGRVPPTSDMICKEPLYAHPAEPAAGDAAPRGMEG